MNYSHDFLSKMFALYLNDSQGQQTTLDKSNLEQDVWSFFFSFLFFLPTMLSNVVSTVLEVWTFETNLKIRKTNLDF